MTTNFRARYGFGAIIYERGLRYSENIKIVFDAEIIQNLSKRYSSWK